MSIPLQTKIVYGPVLSRRLGISLGINPLSPYHKICNFDCIYCQYGRTALKTGLPSSASLFSAEQIIAEVEKAVQPGPKVDVITFSGNGEPTLHPDFVFIVEETRRLRDRFLPKVPVAVYTNGTTLGNEKIHHILEQVEFPLVKMDAGNQTTFSVINRPCADQKFGDLVERVKMLENSILQCIFFKGAVCNSDGKVYRSWLETINQIKPAAVQIYSLTEKDAENDLEPLKPYELRTIAEDVTARLGIKAEAYWAPTTWLR